MKKILCFLVALLVIFCTSCSDNDAYIETSDSTGKTDRVESKPHPSFDFFVDEFDTTINRGDKLTVTATLTNLGNENMELIHGFNLISIYVYTRNVPETVVSPSIAITTDIVANEKIEKNANFYFSEVGTYYLHAKYSFSVGDEYFLYAIEPIEITVVE